MQRNLVTIGECMVELAETPDGTYRRGFAGDTFNAAWYARRALGPDWDVAFASCIGDDSVSDEMASFIEAGGIATDRLRRIPGRSVGLYMISLTAGERSFSYWRDTSAARSLVDDPGWLRRVLSADHVHFSGITLAILLSEGRGRLCDVLARVRENGATVKIRAHAVTDREGRAVRLFVTAGQVSDYKDALALQSGSTQADRLLADRGYDADWFRNTLSEGQKLEPVFRRANCARSRSGTTSADKLGAAVSRLRSDA